MSEFDQIIAELKAIKEMLACHGCCCSGHGYYYYPITAPTNPFWPITCGGTSTPNTTIQWTCDQGCNCKTTLDSSNGERIT